MINTHAGPPPLATRTARVAASPTSKRFAIDDFLQPEWAILPVLIVVIVVGALLNSAFLSFDNIYA